jgi:replicative DNA helicase
MSQALRKVITQAELASNFERRQSGLTTGLESLDQKTGGLHSADLLILAGRSGMGKTSLATSIALGAAKSLSLPGEATKGHVLMFSLQMNALELARWLLTSESRVSKESILKGDFLEGDFKKFKIINERWRKVCLLIGDKPGCTFSSMRKSSRRIHRAISLSLIVVDSIQLLCHLGEAKIVTKSRDLTAIAKGLKALAVELNVPILVVSETWESNADCEDKRPQLSDFRVVGQIDRFADVVMFIHRDEYFVQRDMPRRTECNDEEDFRQAVERWERDMEQVHGKAELILAKQARGPIAKIDLLFESEFARFTDLFIPRTSGNQR